MNDTTEQNVQSRPTPYRKRWWLLYVISVLLALLLILREVTGDMEGARLVMMVLGIAQTMFAAADARYYRKPLPTMSLWVIFIVWPIAVPVCMVRAGGWLRLLWFVLHALAWVIIATVLNTIVMPQ